jgi:hypothetical protein
MNTSEIARSDQLHAERHAVVQVTRIPIARGSARDHHLNGPTIGHHWRTS